MRKKWKALFSVEASNEADLCSATICGGLSLSLMSRFPLETERKDLWLKVKEGLGIGETAPIRKVGVSGNSANEVIKVTDW